MVNRSSLFIGIPVTFLLATGCYFTYSAMAWRSHGRSNLDLVKNLRSKFLCGLSKLSFPAFCRYKHVKAFCRTQQNLPQLDLIGQAQGLPLSLNLIKITFKKYYCLFHSFLCNHTFIELFVAYIQYILSSCVTLLKNLNNSSILVIIIQVAHRAADYLVR